jgi:hypothetical protein
MGERMDDPKRPGPVEQTATVLGIAVAGVWMGVGLLVLALLALTVVLVVAVVLWAISPWLLFFVVASFGVLAVAAIGRRLGI